MAQSSRRPAVRRARHEPPPTLATVADEAGVSRQTVSNALNNPELLRPETLSLLATNQLAPGVRVRFPGVSPTPGKGFGLAGAVTLQPSPEDLPQSRGDVEWGGIAGTHWWISPANDLAGIVMAQRQWAFWHPFALLLKRHACEGALQVAL